MFSFLSLATHLSNICTLVNMGVSMGLAHLGIRLPGWDIGLQTPEGTGRDPSLRVSRKILFRMWALNRQGRVLIKVLFT